ncbi:MAG TPA: hypothetical protein VNK52_10865 [Hyphomicrobiaceae bacterium]|nr:hypothetical protein [Hyphomicrobiaceae bacterium]
MFSGRRLRVALAGLIALVAGLVLAANAGQWHGGGHLTAMVQLPAEVADPTFDHAMGAADVTLDRAYALAAGHLLGHVPTDAERAAGSRRPRPGVRPARSGFARAPPVA